MKNTDESADLKGQNGNENSPSNTLFEDLEAIAGQPLWPGQPVFRIEVPTKKGGSAFVSGVPYETTHYIERAYVFGSRESAQAIIDKHFPDRQAKILEFES